MNMRLAWCKSSVTKNNISNVGVYNEEMLRKDFERVLKDGQSYDITTLKKGKRFRSAFTTDQVAYLEKEFRKYPYIGNGRRKDVANMLNIPERAVKIWFQNRRMKEKKDTTHKEPDDKTIDTSKNKLHSVSVSPLNNDASLPLLITPEDPNNGVSKPVEKHKLQKKESKNINRYDDISSDDENTLHAPKVNSSTPEIRNDDVSTTTSTDYSIKSSKKYKTEKNVMEDMGNSESNYISHEARRHSPLSHMPHKIDLQFPSYPPYVPATSVHQGPQDLSSKPNLQSSPIGTFPTQENTEANLNFYAKGFYAQPYMPPGNMMWKPINVAPVLSAPIPNVAIPNIDLESIMKRGCNCDCHVKPQSAPAIFHQNHSSPNFQYVITAVPLQNHSPKF